MIAVRRPGSAERLAAGDLVAGAAFNRRPDLWLRLGAHGLGVDVRTGVLLARRLGASAGTEPWRG